MSFKINWPDFSEAFLNSAKEQISTALNRGDKPGNIADAILVEELNMGTKPPDLEVLEISDLSEDRFRGIFKLTYDADAYVVLQTKVQANPLTGPKRSLSCNYRFPMLACHKPLVVPMQLRISNLKLRGIVVLVVDKLKGITLVFKNDPLEKVDVCSTFDNIPTIRRFLQKKIEDQLRKMFQDDLPQLIHNLSRVYLAEKERNEKWMALQRSECGEHCFIQTELYEGSDSAYQSIDHVQHQRGYPHRPESYKRSSPLASHHYNRLTPELDGHFASHSHGTCSPHSLHRPHTTDTIQSQHKLHLDSDVNLKNHTKSSSQNTLCCEQEKQQVVVEEDVDDGCETRRASIQSGYYEDDHSTISVHSSASQTLHEKSFRRHSSSSVDGPFKKPNAFFTPRVPFGAVYRANSESESAEDEYFLPYSMPRPSSPQGTCHRLDLHTCGSECHQDTSEEVPMFNPSSNEVAAHLTNLLHSNHTISVNTQDLEHYTFRSSPTVAAVSKSASGNASMPSILLSTSNQRLGNSPGVSTNTRRKRAFIRSVTKIVI